MNSQMIMKTKLQLFPARAAMVLLVAFCANLSAWAASVSTITTSEELVKNSTVYVGEVVVDGVSVIKYLYSGDMTVQSKDAIDELHDALKGMADGDYANLLEGHEFE